MDEQHLPEVTEIPLEAFRLANRICDEYESELRAGRQPNLTAFIARADKSAKAWLLGQLVGLSLDAAAESTSEDAGAALAAANPALAEDIRLAVELMREASVTAKFEQLTPKRPPLATPRRKKSRGLRLRCPHCSNHVELLGDAHLDSVNCTTCGSTFSIIDRDAETRSATTLERIDRFELLSRIGVGGFGTVWKARDTDLDRAVAVKIPRHGQLSREEAELFFREARSVAALRHPNIVPVHEVGRHEDTVFIVSDLVRGVALSDRLSGDRFSSDEAAELCLTLAEALDHAHNQGVIHRDLKPSNVMIADDGQPFLMDFGLAKREAEEVTMTVDGVIVGTPAYMSPEQAEGRAAWVDRRADVYSLGIILYELLTGELPFRGNAQMQLQARRTTDAPNVQRLNRNLSADIATITAKCLEREPGRRYSTARELAEELGRFLRREPILARKISPIERSVRWCQRNPLAAAVATMVCVLAVAGPTAAIIIEGQRWRLSDLVEQKDRLIAARAQEQQNAVADSERLRTQLDLWVGKANPFELWPPDAESPPNQQALESLARARGDALSRSRAEQREPPEEAAYRLITLATLHEATQNEALARDDLSAAATVLDGLASAEPANERYTLALVDALLRLARITSDEVERSESLEAADAAAGRFNADAKRSARLLAARLQTSLTAAVGEGYEDASVSRLEAAERARIALQAAWPEDPNELYQLAAMLAGNYPYLSIGVMERQTKGN